MESPIPSYAKSDFNTFRLIYQGLIVIYGC